jgi:hypothetical protein
MARLSPPNVLMQPDEPLKIQGGRAVGKGSTEATEKAARLNSQGRRRLTPRRQGAKIDASQPRFRRGNCELAHDWQRFAPWRLCVRIHDPFDALSLPERGRRQFSFSP